MPHQPLTGLIPGRVPTGQVAALTQLTPKGHPAEGFLRCNFVPRDLQNLDQAKRWMKAKQDEAWAYWRGWDCPGTLRNAVDQVIQSTASPWHFHKVAFLAWCRRLTRTSSVLSSPLSSRARRSLPLRRQSTPSARRRSATWRLRRASPCR